MTEVRFSRGAAAFSLSARGHSRDTACCNYITGVLYALAGYCHAAAERGEAEVLRYEARPGLLRLAARGGDRLMAAAEAAELGLTQLEAAAPDALRVCLASRSAACYNIRETRSRQPGNAADRVGQAKGFPPAGMKTEAGMNIIQPYLYLDPEELSSDKLRALERAARLCYKSESAITPDSAPDFLRRLLARGHESVIEHEKATVFFVADRGVTHELVRHRVASYSQESTRYCNYSAGRFGGEITVIEPFFFAPDSERRRIWRDSCLAAEKAYLALLADGTPQEARSVLPNSLKTEIAVTYNFREWRHFFRLRCAPQAHPQMQQVTIPLLLLFREKLPCLFEDIPYNTEFPAERYAEVRFVRNS